MKKTKTTAGADESKSDAPEATVFHILIDDECIASWNLINNKFTIDTSTATPEECVAEFLEKYEPFMTVADRTRILVHTAKQRDEWLPA